MIPTGLILTDGGAGRYGHFAVPESGSVTRYLAFYDQSQSDAFELRRRQQRRPVTAESLGESGAWTTWTETLAIGPGGLRQSAIPLVVSSTDIGIAADYDLARWEFQVREQDGTWSASFFPLAYVDVDFTVDLELTGVSSVLLTLASSWVRNGSTITITDILRGSTTDPLSPLPSMLKDTSKPIVFTGIEANGSRSIPLSSFALYPGPNTYMTVIATIATCDAVLGQVVVPVLIAYGPSNAPALSLLANPDDGTVQITVTDAGGAKPIVGCSVMLLGGIGEFDLLPVALGVPTYHRVPPLDVPLTYQAIAIAADGSRKITEDTVTVPSNGQTWFNWDDGWEDSLPLRDSINWGSGISRDKTYFQPEYGMKQVCNSLGYGSEGSVSGEVMWPNLRSKFRSLAWSDKCIFREPQGGRYVISIDKVSPHDNARSITTSLQVDFTEVSPW